VSEALYQQAIIDLARAAHAAGRLSDPTVSVTLHNPLCGDRITLDLTLDGEMVSEVGHRVRGCALCEAAASAIGMHARGASPTELFRAAADIAALIAGKDDEPVWPELLAFQPVRDFKSRHRCILLPFEALADALAKAGAH
jgi:nitrogen fixation protein NifU and related proteins